MRALALLLALSGDISVHLNWGGNTAAAAEEKPVVYLYYPSCPCPWCDKGKQHDWSKYPFRVVPVQVSDDKFDRWPVFHMGATREGTKPAYYFGFNPPKILEEWRKRN